MKILDEANIPSEEMMKRLSHLRAQTCRYEVSSNESLVIQKFNKDLYFIIFYVVK